MIFFVLQQKNVQTNIRLPTKMEKDVVGSTMTKMPQESPMKAPPVTMTNLLHVRVEYAQQVSVLLSTKM